MLFPSTSSTAHGETLDSSQGFAEQNRLPAEYGEENEKAPLEASFSLVGDCPVMIHHARDVAFVALLSA